jgi:hypothetical protein
MSQLRKLKEEQIRQTQELQRAQEAQENEQKRQTQQIQQSQQKRQTQQTQEAQPGRPKRKTEQVRLSRDEEVAEIKLRNAFKLVKEERYGAARHILRQLPDNPKAEKMLAFMEGKTEKRKGPAAISKWGLFITLFVVLAIGGAIGLALFVNSAMEQFTLDELFTQGMMDDAEMGRYMAVVNYCTISTNMEQNKCLQWPVEVISEYPETLDACFAPYADARFLDNADMQDIRACLNRYRVPAPY